MTRYPLYRRLDRCLGRSGRVLKISPAPGFDPRPVQLVASRYTDWAIPAHTYRYIRYAFHIHLFFCSVTQHSFYIGINVSAEPAPLSSWCEWTVLSCIWRQQLPSKCLYSSTSLHGITYLKNVGRAMVQAWHNVILRLLGWLFFLVILCFWLTFCFSHCHVW